ncbi:MAG: DedA family protein [Opitutaceae bacterium]|nr:DedA family protein [Opitutaceae bacterium]
MFETLLAYFNGSPWAIWGLFLVLVGCGLGIPMPEDIVLIAAGICAANLGQPWLVTTAIMYAGVMIGDSIIFALGRHFGPRLLTMPWLLKLFPAEKQERARARFVRHGRKGLFFARFLPGIRAPFFCTAGAMHVPYLRFVLYDGLAALVSVPVFVFLGHWIGLRFAENVDALREAVANTHAWTLAATAVLVLALAIVVFVAWRRRRRSRPA